MSLNWFANILVHHPYVILIGVAVFSGTCLIIPFTLRALPTFTDPQLGYQTRGTPIANKLTTWHNLVEATKEPGPFTVNPREYLKRSNITLFYKKKKNFRKKQKERDANKFSNAPEIYIQTSNVTDPSYDNWREIRKLFNISKANSFGKKEWSQLTRDGFFCGAPHSEYAHVVVSSSRDSDLFNLNALQIICRIERELIETSHYKELCVKTAKRKRCCRPWSLPNYIALLNDRSDCLAITEEDVESTKNLLINCSYYYHNLKLTNDCGTSDACNIPSQCRENNAVFNIFNFITSMSFLPPNKTNDVILKETMIFIPLACSTAIQPYYDELNLNRLSYDGISVVAMDMGIKNLLFDEYLVRDTWLLSFGGLFVLFCMWLYTESLFLTVMTIIAIVFSLGISYFMYTLVFELHFFPFMNLLTVVVVVGIGADDAFVFCKIWHAMKESNSGPMIKVMSCTLHHALLSMIITSFTTAAAFFASYISSITAIRCFSVFASTAVLVNGVMMLIWFPACVVIWEQVPQLQTSLIRGFISMATVRWCCFTRWASTLPYRLNCFDVAGYFRMHNNIVVELVIKFRYLWFVFLTTIAVISGFVVLYYPKLQLPNTSNFQLFESSHPFEKYELQYKHLFWFEKNDAENPEATMPLRFVWGLEPRDNGNYLEPLSFGTLSLDDTFNISHPDSQTWLLKFCKELRKQPFYEPVSGPLLPNCFIEPFIRWMKRRCNDEMENVDRSPCCETETFPYRSWVFDKCIIEAIGDLYATPSAYFIPGVAGPKFTKDQEPTIKAVVVEYHSNYTYSFSYEYMDKFLTEIDGWFKEQLKTAPVTMKGGWFVSDFEFYDLQRVLSRGTLFAIFTAMGLALFVLLFATLNILMSIYAILNITCSILVTMAALVLLGWKLNILESIAVSTAIGLAVDFTLHYSINYKLASVEADSRRLSITRNSLTNMLKPVSMAALTTGAVGAFMIPSTVLAYVQIGTFLIIVMCVSWLYSTFHMGAMLAIAGPQNNFGQCTYTQIFCYTFKKRRKSKLVRNKPATSSISDTHELDLLTSKSSSTSGPNILQQGLSCGGKPNCGRFLFSDQSPSAASAITVIMPDDT